MRLLFIAALLIMFGLPSKSLALQPEEIVVVANDLYQDSVELARYYMQARKIPKKNLLKITTTDRTYIDRERYEEEIAAPVRKFIQKKKAEGSVKCLVTMRGVPLRIDPPKLSGKDKKQLALLKKERVELRQQSKQLPDEQKELKKSLAVKQKKLSEQIKVVSKKNTRAAVDSELTLVLAEDYPLKGWLPNPYFAGFRKQSLEISREKTIFVSRLDAPTEKIVKRMIDDSIFTEKNGLQGKAYIDARWKKPQKKNLTGYAFYDNSLHGVSEYLQSNKLMPVVLNDNQELFQPGDADSAALYVGWYSHHQYIDAFKWQKGAVGYHIASSEASTLRKGKSQVWCKRMLEEGVAATIGPVGEPYVQAFPVPEIFVRTLTDGYYTLAEAYFLSLPFLSWQMILIGDPLYRPFAYRLAE